MVTHRAELRALPLSCGQFTLVAQDSLSSTTPTTACPSHWLASYMPEVHPLSLRDPPPPPRGLRRGGASLLLLLSRLLQEHTCSDSSSTACSAVSWVQQGAAGYLPRQPLRLQGATARAHSWEGSSTGQSTGPWLSHAFKIVGALWIGVEFLSCSARTWQLGQSMGGTTWVAPPLQTVPLHIYVQST